MFFDTKHLKTDEIYLKLDKVSEANLEKKWVDAYHFKICSLFDDTEVGDCNFRVGNTEKLYFGGNIGYNVYEQYRGNHYAGKTCLLLFELAKMHKMSYLIIACNPDNYASRRTCEYAGGKLESIIDLPTDNDMYLEGDRQKCIYKFNLC
ncbi:MAG: GNAT family N-acetyltransferase [Helicobacteraceae bacterium]|jgi:tagatose 1,6-diphosphate aldolase|nr:GNAT family N-acetyltransferase [Helicobacteraceae bacterium]